jgi:hypothetical protein
MYTVYLIIYIYTNQNIIDFDKFNKSIN